MPLLRIVGIVDGKRGLEGVAVRSVSHERKGWCLSDGLSGESANALSCLEVRFDGSKDTAVVG